LPTQTDFESRISEMLQEIKTSDGLQVLHEKQGPILQYVGDAENAFALLARDEKLTLVPELQRCFFRYSEFALHWRALDPESAGGEFDLINLVESIVSGPPGLVTDFTPNEERPLLQSFRVIDDHPQGGTGTLVALRIIEGAISPEVWYYHGTRGSVKLDVDYCGYLDALIVTKGFYGWQYLYADVPLAAHDFTNVAKQLRLRLDLLSRLFPDHDYAPLEERFAQRQRRS
jgi:hypothetical protein